MSNRESTSRTLMVALAVSLVSSVFVAGAAVSLKPVQVENRLLDKQRSILSIAGLGDAEMSSREVKDLFAGRIKARVVDLQTGEYTDAHDAQLFDPLKAARDPKLSDALDGEEDIALIKRRERFTTIYMVEKDGKLESLILPVRGYGLWSTLHGFVALKGDLNTVVGLGFYQHAETPGLGGEVDNPKWKALWPGKVLFDAQGKPAIHIVKGGVDPASPDAKHQVDGLAG
ncbi:MAG TPA: Na(+)-translocating NADH-quinone reductase subunit C, partial [Thauera aminoaromatica]|nr:Na(+)-translocating NADH-quinone reductase subunit C [Thauera aminoaromatica]